LTPQQVVVACVGLRQITEASFQHWSAVARASESPPLKSQSNEQAVMMQVMGFLISADWVIGEARDLKVHVSPAEVRRNFNQTRKQQFPRQREFQAFLKQSKQTVPDLLLRVELNLLSARIQRHVLTGHHGARRQQHALSRFVAHFRTKWTARTYCTPQYDVYDCGHIQAAL
jgi:hypothetical protein